MTIHFHIVVTQILREITFGRSESKEVLYMYFCKLTRHSDFLFLEKMAINLGPLSLMLCA